MNKQPDPSTFAKPHGWATWTTQRRGKSFKTHRSMGLAKTSLTQMDLRTSGEAWVYQFDPDLDQWTEFAHVHDGDRSFFDTLSPKRKAKEVPQAKVDQAIALIREAMERRRPESGDFETADVERARLEQHDELLTSVQTEED